MIDETKREALADYAHAAWSGWMQYLFDKSIFVGDGTVLIPEALVERWTRQLMTPYADLPENEQASDRAEADKMLAIVFPPSPAPHRAYQLRAELGADTLDALIAEIRHMELGLYQGSQGSTGGGPSGGGTWRMEHDPEMTHDRYFELIQAYLARTK